jgi:hypothetical protein
MRFLRTLALAAVLLALAFVAVGWNLSRFLLHAPRSARRTSASCLRRWSPNSSASGIATRSPSCAGSTASPTSNTSSITRTTASPAAGPRAASTRLYSTLITLDPHFQPFYEHAALNLGGLLGQQSASLLPHDRNRLPAGFQPALAQCRRHPAHVLPLAGEAAGAVRLLPHQLARGHPGRFRSDHHLDDQYRPLRVEHGGAGGLLARAAAHDQGGQHGGRLRRAEGAHRAGEDRRQHPGDPGQGLAHRPRCPADEPTRPVAGQRSHRSARAGQAGAGEAGPERLEEVLQARLLRRRYPQENQAFGPIIHG